MALAEIGLVLLAYSLFGLYRMYGHPGVAYVRRLVELGRLKGPSQLRICTSARTATHFFFPTYCLRQRYNRDCWNVEGKIAGRGLAGRARPGSASEIQPANRTVEGQSFYDPAGDASCDAVCFGFGTHEIPTGGAREKLFAEAILNFKAWREGTSV